MLIMKKILLILFAFKSMVSFAAKDASITAISPSSGSTITVVSGEPFTVKFLYKSVGDQTISSSDVSTAYCLNSSFQAHPGTTQVFSHSDLAQGESVEVTITYTLIYATASTASLFFAVQTDGDNNLNNEYFPLNFNFTVAAQKPTDLLIRPVSPVQGSTIDV